MRDLSLIYSATFLRAVATSLFAVILPVYLAKLGLDPLHIGTIVSVGLASAAFTTFLATFFGDRIGRKAFLVATSLLMFVGVALTLTLSNYGALLVASIVGMFNGMGKDRGSLLVLESTILPSLKSPQERTTAFAWYSALQDVGHAVGSLLAGLPVWILARSDAPEIIAYKVPIAAYAAFFLVTTLLYASLSKKVECPRADIRPKVSAESRKIIWKISGLFAIDSAAGGFLTASLLSYFFYERFDASTATIGVLFFFARTLNAVSHLGAAWLAKRIGLVNTMVFTHIPSSLLLASVIIAPNFHVAAILFLLREGFVEMDVPTRQSYVMAVIQPEERTFASGITHLVRMAGWALAPALAGGLMQKVSFGLPILIGASMKIAYDIALYVSFRKIKPPDER